VAGKKIHLKFFFNTTFETGRKIKIRVNTEFGITQLAEIQALKYVNMVGQLPNFIRKRIKSVTIHKGHVNWGGGTDIIIHTGFKAVRRLCGEELMIREAAHGSLDWARGGSVKSSKWKKAAKADNKYISKYAKDFPNREDVAETINWWIAVRCKPDIISKSNYKKVLEAIPNRLKYFDEQNYDTYPLVCK
tara:strand:+ start:204 stop:773 length:570 start_codon:yes stop_codon:yes gene_type:complete